MASANDNIANATLISTLSGSDTVDTSANTTESGETRIGRSAWWKLQAVPGEVLTQLDTNGSGLDTGLAIYYGPANATISQLTFINYDDDSGAGNASMITNTALTVGIWYYIQVGYYQPLAFGGTVVLNWAATAPTVIDATVTINANDSMSSSTAQTIDGLPVTATLAAGTHASAAATLVTLSPPANDRFANATVLTGALGEVTFNITDSATEEGEPHQDETVDPHTVWFTWTAPDDGVARFDTADTPPPRWDSTLTVYSSDTSGPTLADLVSIGWDDDGLLQSGVVDLDGYGTSYVYLPVTAGDVLWIQVGSHDYAAHVDAGVTYPSAGFPRSDCKLRWGYIAPPPPNDNYADAIELTGLVGSVSYNIESATQEDVEVATDDVGSDAGTAWWLWTPGIDGSATFVTIDNVRIEAFIVTDNSGSQRSLAPAGGGTGTLTFSLRVAEQYAIRVYSLALTPAEQTLDWVAGATDIQVTVRTPVVETPGVLAVNVTDEPAGESVDFTIDSDSTVLATAVVDTDGTSPYVSIVLPDLDNGAHIVVAHGADDRTGFAAFTVANGTFTTGTTDPDPVAPPTPVTHWRFYDPTDATAWSFPINPKDHDSVMQDRAVTVTRTTGMRERRYIMFSGPKHAKKWTITGDLLTLADCEALKAWAAKPYRVYLNDDFGRTHIVKVLRVATTQVHDAQRPEHHSYELTCLLYRNWESD